jgi:hypothetical protein
MANLASFLYQVDVPSEASQSAPVQMRAASTNSNNNSSINNQHLHYLLLSTNTT